MIYSINQYRKPEGLDDCYSFKSLFTPDECDLIIEQASHLPTETATAGGRVNPDFRHSQIAWIEPLNSLPMESDVQPDQQTFDARWVYQRLAKAMIEANNAQWQFNVDGMREKIQFTRYDAGALPDPNDERETQPSGRFKPHLDLGKVGPHRKISAVVQLTPDTEYTGGDLNLYRTEEPLRAYKGQGSCIMFPSYMLHEVTRITSGTRHSLVVWFSGEPFR